MRAQRFNWPIWTAFLLSLIALFSYPFVFVNWPLTRDFPWANLLLFAIAAVLLFFGLRRAFSSGRRRLSKIAAAVVATLSVLLMGFFVFSFFIASRWLPASHGAPQVGQKAPDFTLTDTNNKQVSLASLLSEPINGKAAKGVLMIFYRGYW
jgi:predicted PurR-regulated permease PerM